MKTHERRRTLNVAFYGTGKTKAEPERKNRTMKSGYEIRKYTTTEWVVAQVEDGAGIIIAHCSNEAQAQKIAAQAERIEKLEAALAEAKTP